MTDDPYRVRETGDQIDSPVESGPGLWRAAIVVCVVTNLGVLAIAADLASTPPGAVILPMMHGLWTFILALIGLLVGVPLSIGAMVERKQFSLSGLLVLLGNLLPLPLGYYAQQLVAAIVGFTMD